MKITKKSDHYILENKQGSYHLSIEDYDRLGKEKAIELAKENIDKKNRVTSLQTVTFDNLRSLGFCEFGITDAANRLGLDVNGTYTIEDIEIAITSLEDPLDLILRDYPNEFSKLLGKSFYKQFEDEISNSAHHSYWYARDIIKGRFELGEKAISEHHYYSYWYAKNALKGRFELGEGVISKDAYYRYSYNHHLSTKL